MLAPRLNCIIPPLIDRVSKLVKPTREGDTMARQSGSGNNSCRGDGRADGAAKMAPETRPIARIE